MIVSPTAPKPQKERPDHAAFAWFLGLLKMRISGNPALLRICICALAFSPTVAMAKTEFDAGQYKNYGSVDDVEIVDNVSCLPPEPLAKLVLEQMKVSENRAFQVGPVDATHIRWIIGGLPDAGGSTRSIGSVGSAYSATPFWRHPIEVRIQLIADSVVVKELSRKAKSLCNPGSPRLATIIRKLTKKLFQAQEVLSEHKKS